MEIMEHQRKKYQGLWQILLFNSRSYVAGAIVLVAGVSVLLLFPLNPWSKAVLIVGLAFTAYWAVISLVVSYLVYDRSGICEWQWVPETLAQSPGRWANIHAGLDESSAVLHRLFPDSRGVTLDIFDPLEMTEPSISAARSAARQTNEARPVDFRNLPLATGELDAVFLFFAAHEIRRPDSRDEFLSEDQAGAEAGWSRNHGGTFARLAKLRRLRTGFYSFSLTPNVA